MSTSNTKPRLYLLRLNERLPESLKGNVIGIGWSNASGLIEINDRTAFKKRVRDTHANYVGNERSLGNAVGSIWRFLKDMKKGDLVIVPIPYAFYVARLSDDAPFYDAKGVASDYAYRRKVDWLNNKKPIPRNDVSARLQRGMKAYSTCVEFYAEFIPDVMAAVEGKKAPNFSNAIRINTREIVARALQESVNDQGLEELVKRLAEASGATASVQPKKSGKRGDADVIAEYELNPSGDPLATLRVAYQVKQHEGTTGDWGVKQLRERMSDDNAIVRGCLVTTAEVISDEAKKEIEDARVAGFDIFVVTRDQLIDWVLSTGLNALTEIGNEAK